MPDCLGGGGRRQDFFRRAVDGKGEGEIDGSNLCSREEEAGIKAQEGKPHIPLDTALERNTKMGQRPKSGDVQPCLLP